MGRCQKVFFTYIKLFQSSLHRMIQEQKIIMPQEKHLSTLQNIQRINHFIAQPSLHLRTMFMTISLIHELGTPYFFITHTSILLSVLLSHTHRQRPKTPKLYKFGQFS